MIETEDGITTPSDTDERKLVQDLAGMAVTVQEALNLRANIYKGTSADRGQFTSQAQEGVLWKDTNGEKILWAKEGTGWKRVWPENRDSGVFVIGSNTQEFSTTGQLQLRRYFSATGNRTHANLLMSSDESHGLTVVNWKNGSVASQLRLGLDGSITNQTRVGGTVTRYLPFAMEAGTVAVPGGSGTRTSTQVTFSTGRFTQVPHVFLQYRGMSSAGMAADYGVYRLTKTGFEAWMNRSNDTPTNFSYLAVQVAPDASTHPDTEEI